MGKNNSDKMLYLGLFILVFGIFLLTYSVSIHLEMKTLTKNIDLDYLSEDKDMPTTEKYYKYIDISEYLNKKLDKNKDLVIKNVSCVYADYAWQNAVDLQYLVKMNFRDDTTKRNVSSSIINNLYITLNNYKSCTDVAAHQTNLKEIMDDIQKSEAIDELSPDRFDRFSTQASDRFPSDTTETYPETYPEKNSTTRMEMNSPQEQYKTNVEN